jgi:hypothetical protein
MPAKSDLDVRLEIGHVLFIDIVGYSKLLINEQSEQIQKLKQIVRGTEQFRIAEAVQKHKDIWRLLKAGHSIRNAAKIAGKGVSTVQRVKLALAA